MKGWAWGVLKQSGNHTALNGSNKLLTILHYGITSFFFFFLLLVSRVPAPLRSVIYTFFFMVTLEENSWDLKGSNSAFSRQGGGNAIISECPRNHTSAPSSPAAAGSTLTRLGQGCRLMTPTTRLIVLISSPAIRQISLCTSTRLLHCATQVGSSVHSKKLQILLGNFHHQQRFGISACIWGDSGGCSSHLSPGKEAVAGLCVGSRAGFVCAGAPSPSSPQMVRSHDCTVKIELV